MYEPAHLVEVAQAGRIKDRTGAEEQQALEQRMVEDVKQGGGQSERSRPFHRIGAEAEGETKAIDSRLILALREPGDLNDPIGSRTIEEAVRDITALGGTFRIRPCERGTRLRILLRTPLDERSTAASPSRNLSNTVA